MDFSEKSWFYGTLSCGFPYMATWGGGHLHPLACFCRSGLLPGAVGLALAAGSRLAGFGWLWLGFLSGSGFRLAFP